jgi:hypothetical protein
VRRLLGLVGRLVNPFICLKGALDRLRTSVDRLGITVDELGITVDELQLTVDGHQITVDKYWMSVDRRWTSVDGQIVRWHEFQDAVDISMSFVDECGITLRGYVQGMFN